MTLDRAPLHAPLTLLRLDVPHATLARLTALGLRRGVSVEVVQKLAAGGRVVAVGGGRIALARDILARLDVEAAA